MKSRLCHGTGYGGYGGYGGTGNGNGYGYGYGTGDGTGGGYGYGGDGNDGTGTGTVDGYGTRDDLLPPNYHVTHVSEGDSIQTTTILALCALNKLS